MKEEHRIKIAAAEWAYDKVDVSAYQGYIAGATAERELMAEQLKQVRNKAIDEVHQLLKNYTGAFTSYVHLQELKKELESLKH